MILEYIKQKIKENDNFKIIVADSNSPLPVSE